MKAHLRMITKLMVLIIATVMCGAPEFAQAMQQQETANLQGQQDQQNGTTIDPSKGPLQPVPTQNAPAENTSPNMPESSTDMLPATPAPRPQPQQQMQEPLGAATAEGVPVVGGAASRPAGEAIAPEKQKQRRSLLLKIGLIAAAGVAIGVVAGASKGTSAKP
jgi:cell division protein FtsN